MNFNIFIHYVMKGDFYRHVVHIKGDTHGVYGAAQAAWDHFASIPGVTMMTERP